MKALAVLLLVAACDDGVDLTGTYEVTAELGSAPCGSDTAVTIQSPFLHFFKTKIFIGDEIFTYEECDDAQLVGCTGSGLFSHTFPEQIDNGWRGITTGTSSSGMMCTLSYIEESAKLTGKLLVVEESIHSESVDMASCTIDEADKRGAKMPCTSHHRIEATKL